MKINKKVKMGLKITGGVIFLLFATLIIHIVIMVKNRPPLANGNVQLARADFKQNVDSSSAKYIQTRIKELPGVKSTYFNLKDDILIYAYDNRQNSAQSIYDRAIKDCGFSSVRYTVKAEDMANGCPVMDDHSFYGKMTRVITKIVN